MNKAAKIFYTEAVGKRLSGLEDEITARGYSTSDIAKALQMVSNHLALILQGKRYPSLHTYMRMAEFFGWNVTHDVNAMYYHRNTSKGMSDTELMARLVRVKSAVPYREYERFKLALHYGRISGLTYAEILYAVSKGEKELGLDHPLELEE